MKIVADTHTHTVASTHAYSTILENTAAAKQNGLSFICMTDHGIAMPDAPHIWHFENLRVIPDILNDVIVLKGVEANLVNHKGELDMPDELLNKMDWVIASYHKPVCAPGSVAEHTKSWLKVAQNPNVDVIGHCGDARFDFDFERVIKAFAEYDKIVEINTASFLIRPGTPQRCREIAILCKKYNVKIVVNSDCHFAVNIGKVEPAINMLTDINFPEQLIMNADYDRFLELARKKSGKKLI